MCGYKLSHSFLCLFTQSTKLCHVAAQMFDITWQNATVNERISILIIRKFFIIQLNHEFWFMLCSYLYMQTASRSNDLLSNNSAWYRSLKYIIPADLFATATSLSRAIAEENWGRVAEIKHAWCSLLVYKNWQQVKFFLRCTTIYSFNITMSYSKRGEKEVFIIQSETLHPAITYGFQGEISL